MLRRSPDGGVVEELFSLPALYEDSPEMQKLRFYATGEDWLFFDGNPYADPAISGAAYQLYRFRPATHELTPLFDGPSEDGVGALLSERSLRHGRMVSSSSARRIRILRRRSTAGGQGRPSVEAIMSLPASAAVSPAAISASGSWWRRGFAW